MLKKTLQTVFLSLLLWSLSAAPAASAAAFYNFGTLDVRPVHPAGTESRDWFIEYMKPGEQKQEAIQVSNFSNETKELTVYVSDTSHNEAKNFYTRGIREKSDDVADWVRLPVQSLTLASGESKIMSINFTLPRNAGVGMHTGAIIVRENGSEFSIEKGVRVYMNVVGPMIAESQFIGMSAAENSETYGLNIQTFNTGTVDLREEYKLSMTTFFGAPYDETIGAARTEPQTTGTTNLSLEKPSFGLFHLFISHEGETSYAGTVLFVPFWMPLAVLALILVLIRPRAAAIDWSAFARAIRGPELRQSFAYIGLFVLVGTVAVTTSNVATNMVRAQIAIGQSVRELSTEEEAAESYELTIKWGQFRNVMIPREKRKEWHGRLYFSNARIKTTEVLHLERNDRAEVAGGKSTLRFDTITGPDNDGIKIFVEPTSDQVPIARYENIETGEEFEFLITDYLNAPGIFPDGIWATQFQTDYGEQEQLRLQALELTTLRELGATPELEATPPPVAQIPELENLFVEELPATKEALTDFVLNSDYVDEIVEENSTRRVKTDSILIKALEATPEVLSEVAATPDLNFLFVPTETVNFPAQEFSFDEDKESEQTLGTLIFVQNKEEPWNTFVGTTDFQLLSGDAIIPASELTIDPGLPTVLKDENGTGVLAGNIQKLTGSHDRVTLVNVDPSPGEKEVFVLNPKLRVRIPMGTPPGTYRGELTITSL